MKTYWWTTWNSDMLLHGRTKSQRHSGSSYNLFGLNKTVWYLRHWNSHLLSLWLALLLLCDVSYVKCMRSSHDNFSIVEQRTSQRNDNASKSSSYQGCGAGTQSSGSGSSSGHLNFLASSPTSASFWLRLQNNLVQKIRENKVLFSGLRSRSAPELGIFPGAGAKIKNQKEPELKLKIRRNRSSV